MKKKTLQLVRGISFWVLYDPRRKEIRNTYKYKYQVPVVSGCHAVQVKGYYVPERK
jgi:hypothetical protein